jgi:3-oxoacyl-[acyl-carrier protein] reductase
MDFNLKGKHALIGGGSKGIGFASALEIAKMGASVSLVSRNIDSLSHALSQLPRADAQAHDFFVADFKNPEGLREKIAELIKTRPVHILVNNSGGPAAGSIKEADEEDFQSAFVQHLICNHILVKATLPGMIDYGYGRIINIISTSVKQPINKLGVSNTIRGAVANWAKTLANEVGIHGVTVNNVLPGATSTQRLEDIIKAKSKRTGVPEDDVILEMKQSIPLRRFGKPSEIGSVVAFLASPAASYISGTNIVVDGGRTKSL